jgi:AcrR family transcriptional regulator
MMAGSPRSTRQHILDTATELFFNEGYRAVGVDTIIERSGVAKMTLYRHFPSKNDLIVAYLEQMNGLFWTWFEQATGQHPDSPRAQLVAVFEALVSLVNSPECRGCPFIHAAVEFPEPEHPAHQVAINHKQAVRARFRDLAMQAGARQPDVLADQLLLLQVRMRGTIDAANQVARAARMLIDAQLEEQK